MDSLWYKYKRLPYRKRQTLRSLGAGFAFFILLYAFTSIFSVPLCPVKRIFGVSCPGCGLTRGFIEILHLRFLSAASCNIMSLPLFFSAALYFILVFTDIFFNKDYIEKTENLLAKKPMYAVYIIILIISALLNNIH